jgi:hypothetical protein
LSIIENAILAISIIVEDCTSLFQDDRYVKIIEYMLKPIFALLAPESGDLSPQAQLTKLNIKAHAVNTIRMLLVSQCS